MMTDQGVWWRDALMGEYVSGLMDCDSDWVVRWPRQLGDERWADGVEKRERKKRWIDVVMVQRKVWNRRRFTMEREIASTESVNGAQV
jgi:hypothetical protein